MSATLPDPSTLSGSNRYVRTAETFLDINLTQAQRRILTALAEHDRVHVESGNGVGKSFVAAVANGAFLLRHPDSICMATSGTYSVLNDVLWKPLRRLWRREELPGRTLESPPRIRVDDEWYFKAVAPRHPGNLEGRHAGTMLVTIEEVDKPDITQEHFDSAESMLTGSDDRFLAISNPPHDETNVAAELAQSDRWHTIRFSSFDSHNVRVDAGETDADRIPGLVGLDTVRDDWETWNDEPWPGLDDARTAHERRDDLDERWYRRRAGVMPPDSASAHRPFGVAAVRRAYQQPTGDVADFPQAVGIDVARSGDRTVMVGIHGAAFRVHYAERGDDHATQERTLAEMLNRWPQCPIAIDAVGEGSGLADGLAERFPDVHRFNAGETAADDTTYRDKWAEGLQHFGDQLAAGGTLDSQYLREAALVAARTVRFDETHLASRDDHGATVLEATSKSQVKDELGRSPDHLDAALMAAWIDRADPEAHDDRHDSATISW